MDQNLIISPELLELAEAPLKWGLSDCVSWAVLACSKVAGFDPRAHTPWTWSSCREAYCRLQEHGSLQEAAAVALGHLGFTPCLAANAPLGALGVIMAQEQAMAVAVGPGWWAVKGPSGLALVPNRDVIEAWDWRTSPWRK